MAKTKKQKLEDEFYEVPNPSPTLFFVSCLIALIQLVGFTTLPWWYSTLVIALIMIIPSFFVWLDFKSVQEGNRIVASFIPENLDWVSEKRIGTF